MRKVFCSFPFLAGCVPVIVSSSSSTSHHLDACLLLPLLILCLFWSVCLHRFLSACLTPSPNGAFVCLHRKYSKWKGVALLGRSRLLVGTLSVCTVRAFHVCLYVHACARATAVHCKAVMNSSAKQRHTTAWRSIFNKNSAVHKQRKKTLFVCVRVCVCVCVW